jgi:hypothetical protein
MIKNVELVRNLIAAKQSYILLCNQMRTQELNISARNNEMILRSNFWLYLLLVDSSQVVVRSREASCNTQSCFIECCCGAHHVPVSHSKWKYRILKFLLSKMSTTNLHITPECNRGKSQKLVILEDPRIILGSSKRIKASFQDKLDNRAELCTIHNSSLK